jgi:L-aminopeptidase/D-esterase-like protein
MRLAILLLILLALPAGAQARARDIGVPFEGKPGPLNALTDVPGVEVGQVTLIRGAGALRVGEGPVRTGVTVILPRGRADARPVYGGFFNLNGNGEMTGQSYLEDFGAISGPIGLTDTNAVGHVYAGIQEWTSKRFGTAAWPVVAETWSGRLNDIEGFHVTAETAKAALEAAKPGAIDEGNVGGGTGMVCFGFKGGIGTASRLVEIDRQTYTIGVLAQCNTGDRKVLRIAGVPVGAELANRWLPCIEPKYATSDGSLKTCAGTGATGDPPGDQGSIIIVVGTDAPLDPLQLNRVARRAAMGLARLGSYAGNQSGDLILSFSTGVADINDPEEGKPSVPSPIGNVKLDALFNAVAQASEEAIVNALVGARTMTGIDGMRYYALPHDELRAVLKRYNRLDDRRH